MPESHVAHVIDRREHFDGLDNDFFDVVNGCIHNLNSHCVDVDNNQTGDRLLHPSPNIPIANGKIEFSIP